MKTRLFAAAALTLSALLGSAVHAADAAVDREVEIGSGQTLDPGGYEEVARIPLLRHPYSFDVIDDDKLIIWRTRSDAYLVQLKWSSPELRFARGIGVTSFGSSVYPFDDVLVRGLRYPIDRIYRLERAEAERLAELG